VPGYDGLFDQVVKILGVNDDHDRMRGRVQRQSGHTSQPPGRSRITSM